METPDHPAKVSIDDLLHLKRAERPAADFWVGFERELRQKQLSALVEKRSWWNDLPQLFARRIYLPIGATAILTFSIVSVKYYSSFRVVQPVAGQAILAGASGYANESSLTNEQPVSASTNRENQIGSGAIDQPIVVASTPSLDVVSKSMAIQNANDASIESPYARSIAANLARLEQSEPDLVNSVLGSRLSSTSHLQASSTPAVEMASLSIGGSSKRTRLLARYNDRQLNTEPTAPEAIRERIARRLNDSEFNDRFSRIGVKADQVSLKF